MATPIPIYRYPEDGTGKSPDNLVVGEEHQLSNRTIRCIAPTYGGFFAKGVIVTDLATELPLIHNVDYNFGELFEFPSGRYGQEIFGIIAIKKPGVTKVSIQYQALGGNYSYSMDAVIAMIDSLNIGERPVEWGKIVGRPTLFDPASHFHDLGDVYGFEYVVHSLDLLRQAILIGDVASHDEIYRFIDRLGEGQKDAIDAVRAVIDAHMSDQDNPHRVTKAQVGLDQVQNYPIANNVIALTGSSNAHYVTPASLVYVVEQKAGAALNLHIADKANPHGVTKTQVGLGNVSNFPPATSSQTAEGTSDQLYVTPQGLAFTMDKWFDDGKFDGRYISFNDPTKESSINVINNIAYIRVGNVWRQFWPPVWQA